MAILNFKHLQNNDIMDNEYKKLDQDKANLSKYWDAAIGLQKVDNLEPSSYLYELKDKNIKGVLTNKEIEDLLYKKYETETEEEIANRKKECDIVVNRMAEILSERGSTRLIPVNFALYTVIVLFSDALNFILYTHVPLDSL